ncbi:uncharacterized protein PGTG_10680, partial [Puccinia graminis f. sp. tritici CRL 75-36-700-3]
MENDSDSAEHIRPPLEEFDEPAPAENYWDSEDKCELDWIDILPEDEANHHGEREQKKGDEEKEKKGKDSPWYPFRNKHYLAGSLIVGFLHKIVSRSIYHYIRQILLILCDVYLPGYEALRRKRKKPSISSSSENKNLVLRIPSNILFEDSNLITLPVDDLDLTYSEIKTKSGKKLSDLCGNCIEESDGSQVTTINLPNPWRTKAHGRIIRHTPINLYCNDTSGNVSKQWNKHISYYFTLSGLPPVNSRQEFNCHFLCTSNTASALEMGQIIVPEMNKISSEGFDAYDVSLSEEVLVMTSVFSFLGDSPMHAEVTSTPVPSAALNPCRFCVLLASSLLKKVTMKYLQEFLQMSSHGTEVCKISYILFILKKIWNLAKEKKSEKKSDELSIKCGVQDQLNRHFASEIYQSKRLKKKLKKNKETIPDHLKSGIPQHIVDLEKNDPTDLFNPYSELEGAKVSLDITPFSEVKKLILVVVIPGFDGTIHTPVEILHVFLLGMVKYLFRDFMNSLKPTKKDELIGLWRSFGTDALNIPSLKPVGLVKYYSSLIGKDFKVIVQAAPFLFFQFMDGPRKNIWHALCHLALLVFQTHITDMDEFLSEL